MKKINQIQEAKEVREVREAKEANPKKQRITDINVNDYEAYASIKMIEVAGGKLNKEAAKVVLEYEDEFKKSGNKVASCTRRLAIGPEVYPLFEGVPVPKEYQDAISAKAPAYLK